MTPFQISENVQLDELLVTAHTLQMSPQQTLDLIGSAIDFVTTKPKRVFAYTDPVDAAQPAQCRAIFVRSFVHADWIDGESVVQAGTTTLEEGFNARFHKIEEDLDALAVDIAKAFVCLGEQRAEVSRALEEVKTEINRINSDIHDCCHDKTDTTFPYSPIPYPGPYLPDIRAGGPYFPNYSNYSNYPIYTNYPINPVVGQATAPVVNPVNYLRGVGPGIPWGGETADPVRTFIDSVSGANAYAAATASVMRSTTDPSMGVIAGMPARLIEENSFNGNPVDVWSTALGLVLTPRAASAPAEGRATWINPRVGAAGNFATWAAGKEAQATRELGTEFTVAAFTEKYGNETVEGGMRVADLLKSLAGDTKAASPMELVAPLAESSAREILREGFASETVIGAVGLNPGPAAVADAPVSALKSVDKAIVEGIAKIGIGTVGELAAAPPADIVKRLKRAKIDIGIDQVAAINAQAATLVAVDRTARGGAVRPGPARE